MRTCALAVLLLAGCGSSSRDLAPADQTELSRIDVEAWAGSRAPTTDAPTADGEPIELSDGARFRSLLAVTTYEGDAAPHHCSLYGLRFSEGTLEEGRRSLACDAAPAVDAASVPFGPVDDARRAHLRAVLHGAALGEHTAPSNADHDRIVVRVETDRGVVENEVPPTTWPEPYAEPDPPLGRAPRSLAELWEAVMYPERYVEAP